MFLLTLKRTEYNFTRNIHNRKSFVGNRLLYMSKKKNQVNKVVESEAHNLETSENNNKNA